ncbi:hypothetical protein HMPREF1555_01186 [Porphyromonas gingivalis F0570]|uniref:Uncharacterized protein n=2 Tax=Porphyromonas gingivalis TaxID=837 RepID=A0A0E2LQ78_PORGN|nr:hypothetical protein HMPREF1555_01186 [Porphyromonas gingivalis F0570]
MSMNRVSDFTNRNRCNCDARILKKWNVNYFVLVRDFFCSRTKIKKFSRHVFRSMKQKILRT